MQRYMMNVVTNAVMDLVETAMSNSSVLIEVTREEAEAVIHKGKTWRDIRDAREVKVRPPDWFGRITSETVTVQDCSGIPDRDIVPFYQAALNLVPDPIAPGESAAAYATRIRADLVKKVEKLEAARAKAEALREKNAAEKRRRAEKAAAENGLENFKTLGSVE